jgi:hypothetical protein
VVLHAVEFLLLFLIGPTLFAYTRHRIPAIPVLWVLTAYCLFMLLRDPAFRRRSLWNFAPLGHYAEPILVLFAAAAAIGIALVLRFGSPGQFLNFPRSNPRLWTTVMMLYPILSVYPQGIVYRAFVFDRYRDLFGPPWAIVLASAFAFTYVHIVFHNELALILTGLGGILFGIRFLETGSLFVTSFEHSLYGCFLFTVGVGRSFHHAAALKHRASMEPQTSPRLPQQNSALHAE